MSSALKCSDYTVGWICALPLELAASSVMLDEEHEFPSDFGSLDDNSYRFGTVNHHNVVQACLPSGRPGKASAAAVASSMRSSFKSLHFSLMVGIGGGVPSTRTDIRLGDVAVSQPSGQFGGVIQYDFGKAKKDGFERKGHLNSPPTFLLSALSTLQAKHEISQNDFNTNLSSALAKLPQAYSSPGATNDILFQRHYGHVQGSRFCEKCDKKFEQTREPRKSSHPHIFYGTIASADQVMANETRRDELFSEARVICFEMEGAGLMNDFQCLVIRGISDYSDSHKDVGWQRYAATTAAAYAKTLLHVVQTSASKSTQISEAVLSRETRFEVGVASLLGQVYSACVTALDVRAKSLHFGRDLLTFNAELDVLSARMKAWGQGWRIPQQKHRDSPRFREFGFFAVNTLLVIYRLIQSLNTLQKEFPYFEGKYDMTTVGLAAGLEQLSLLEDPDSISADIRESLINMIQEDSTMKESFPWVVNDGESKKLIQDLASLILSLERLLPPPQGSGNQALVFSKYLASDDTEWLQALASAQGDVPPAFSGAAELKRLSSRIRGNLTLAQATMPSKTLRIRETDVTWYKDDPDELRTIGTYKGSTVLIEWKPHDPKWRKKRIELDMLERVYNIARLLRQGMKPDAFRTLMCQGIFEDEVIDGTSQFGFVFSIPPHQNPRVFHSLRDLLENQAARPHLGQRFQLARSIAVSILTLHVSGWLHKGLRSHNILFFPSSDLMIEFSEPYLCGFEYSRADAPHEVTEQVSAHKEFDRYRHPNCQGVPVDSIASGDEAGRRKSYTKVFDIYSLGIVLVEIRRWSAAVYWPEGGENGNPAEFRDGLVKTESDELGFSMGEGYKNAVIKCLTGAFDLSDRKSMELALYLEVVKELERCSA